MHRNRIPEKQTGQTLIELLVVITIVIIIVGALVFGIIASIRNASFAKNQAQATKYAQEGIERVRAGRDRNDVISIPPSPVTNWNGNGNAGTDIWSYQIYNGCGSPAPNICYLKLSAISGGALTWIATANTFPSSYAEPVGQFKRAVILSDNSATYGVEKTVTVLVTWTDVSGSHESRLTTVLRKI